MKYPLLPLFLLLALKAGDVRAQNDLSSNVIVAESSGEALDSTSSPPLIGGPEEVTMNPTSDSIYSIDKTVVTGRSRSLTRRESEFVARMPLKNLENPQSYQVVSKELADQQLVTDYNSMYKNLPGTSRNGQWMQGASQFFTRGFTTTTDVRNGLSVHRVTDIDPVNVERIEAIRGPAGTLFGAGNGISYGGLFNTVTKKPYQTFGGEVSVSGGSWDLGRAALDVNAPLNAEKTLLLRLNAAKHNEGSFMDQGFTDSWTLAPSLTYQVSDRLKLSLDLEFYHRTGTSVPTFWVTEGISANSIEQLGLDPFRAFIDNSTETESRTANIFTTADYKLSENWTSETVAAFTSSQSDLFSIYLGIGDDSFAERWLDWQAWKVNTRQFQQNFRGDVTTGAIRNQMLVGFGISAYNYLWPYVIDGDTVNFHDLDADYYVGLEQYRARIAANPLNMWTSENYTYYAYFSDAVHFGDRFTALLGLRWDRFDDRGGSDGIGQVSGIYEQDAFSPKLGIVYHLMPQRVALYGNLMSGYSNVDGRSIDGDRFDPEHAYQGETGIKVQAAKGRLTGTVAAYGVQVRDVVRSDPNHPGFSIQNGTQNSYGIEVDVTAQPWEGLDVVVGYAWNRSELTQADPEFEGRRPTSAGPELAANFWTTYEIPAGKVRGLGAGLGGNYASRAYANNSQSFAFTVPSYFTLDATLFYDQPAYRLGLKVDNIADERYWSPGSLQVGPPRRFVGNVTYKF